MVIDYIERRWGQGARAAESARAVKDYSPLA
jgi:hypothetical protein